MTALSIEPWRPRHPLEGALSKIRRARRKIEEINELIQLWESLNPNEVVGELDADREFYNCSLVARFPPFIDVGLVLGEFAYQLRSSLDQIIFALSVFPEHLTDDERDRAERTTAFPILRRPSDQTISSRLRYVDERIRNQVSKAIDAVQPYQRANLADQDELALLDKMNILDKHRVLHPAIGAFRIDTTNLSAGVWLAEGPINDGDVIARVPAHLDFKAELNGRFFREVLIPLSSPNDRIPLGRIGDIYSCVAFDVLPRFIDFFEPLPPTVELPSPSS